MEATTSIHCKRRPPNKLPNVLVSLGITICVCVVNDSLAVFAFIGDATEFSAKILRFPEFDTNERFVEGDTLYLRKKHSYGISIHKIAAHYFHCYLVCRVILYCSPVCISYRG